MVAELGLPDPRDLSSRFLEAHTAPLGMGDVMQGAAESRIVMAPDQLNDRARTISIRLWHLQVTWCDGKALGVAVVKLARKNGLEAWRQLKIEYDSRTGNRWTAMLRFILSPQDKLAKDREAGTDLLQSLTALDSIVAEYAGQSGGAVSDDVRVSVLFEHAPEPCCEVLRHAPEKAGASSAAARSHVRGYCNQGRAFDVVDSGAGLAPTQVGAVTCGGKTGGKADGKIGGKGGRTGGKHGKDG